MHDCLNDKNSPSGYFSVIAVEEAFDMLGPKNGFVRSLVSIPSHNNNNNLFMLHYAAHRNVT